MSKFASLTAGLLARKGEAEPAATPFADELLTRVGAPAADIRALTPMPHPHAPKPPAPKPLSDPATAVFGSFGRRTAAELERAQHEAPSNVTQLHHDEEDQCSSCVGPLPEDATKTFHVNLRLKRPRFIKLKLSAALLHRPVQEVVSEALDAWFDKLPPDVLGDCACLKLRGE